jgi:hypothetical protein
MIFKTFGPFEIGLDVHRSIPASMRPFWENVEVHHNGLPAARGCYVFGIRTSGGPRITPWYIGRTNRQTFETECFKAHQRNHYWGAMNRYDRAKPFLFLVAQMKEDGQRFYRGQALAAIDFVETYLIGFGLRANPELLNKRDTRLYREVRIRGLLNSGYGNPGSPTNELRLALDF